MTRTYIELSAESRQAVAMDAGLNWEAEGQVINRDEWQRSEDPAAMIRLATGRRSRCCGTVWCDNGDGTVSLADGFRERPCCGNREAEYDRLVSDRKLLLFIAAVERKWLSVRRGVLENEQQLRKLEAIADGQLPIQHLAGVIVSYSFPGAAVVDVAIECVRIHNLPNDKPKWCRTLRDIIRDPFSPPKPLAPPKHLRDCPHCRHYGRYCSVCHGTTRVEAACGSCLDAKRVYTGIDGMKWVPCNVCPEGPPGWLTPEVLSLAEAAYTLRNADGTLDPLRLSVLADCLIDAGCDNEGLLRHLRGKQVCRSCMLPTPEEAEYGGGDYWCPGCGGTKTLGHGNEGWEASGCPHYRGMWSLDLLLGKS